MNNEEYDNYDEYDEEEQPKPRTNNNPWIKFLQECSSKLPPDTSFTDRAKLCSVEYRKMKQTQI